MSSLWTLSLPWTHLVLRGGVVYIAILFLLRLSGKRQVGQMGVGEFVAILLISNAVQNSMNGGDNSITGGLILAAVILALSYLTEFLAFKSKKWEALIQGRPRLLIHQGQLLRQNLEKELISPHELGTMLRKQGIQNVTDIHEAVLESDGSISVIRSGEVAGGAKL